MRKFERIVALLLVFILVIATNVMDNTSFRVVKESIGNIYEDRLVAYDLTYKMHNEVADRRVTLLTSDTKQQQATIKQFNASIDQLITQYATTKLTTKEAGYFEVLQAQFESLKQLENKYISATEGAENTQLLNSMETELAGIVSTLNSLATIQIDEGKRQVINSNRAIKTSDMLSKFEIVSIVVIGLLILFLIIYEPKI